VALATAEQTVTDFPTWVYRFRMYLGYTQSEFADLIDSTLSSISKYEGGRQTPPGPTRLLLAKLAHEYGFSEEQPEVTSRMGPRPRK
jgi:transcriptional regulator with XRE-family HTH domain